MFTLSRLPLLVLIVCTIVLIIYSFVGVGSSVKIIPTSQGVAMIFQIYPADKGVYEKLGQQLDVTGLFDQPITLSLDAQSRFLVKDWPGLTFNISYSDSVVNFGSQSIVDRLKDYFKTDKTEWKILQFLPEDTVLWAKMASHDFWQFWPVSWPNDTKDFLEEFLTGDAILAIVPDGGNLGVVAISRDLPDPEQTMKKFQQLSKPMMAVFAEDTIEDIQVWSQVSTMPENSWWLFYYQDTWVLSSSANLARQEAALVKSNGSSILQNLGFITVSRDAGKFWQRQIYWRGPKENIKLPQKINLAAYGTINLGQKDLVFESLINKIAAIMIVQSDYIIKGKVLLDDSK
ncbi:hypothetical protein HY388_01145 [Candidatus Daviesbacteria bacterium]|nr:hypothetical protein [Candidatus Daviesbacteria bacterium]